MSTGILPRSISDLPVAVIDFETTGLSADLDRALELSIVRVDPGATRPTLVFDSLINPGGRVAATEIHGITDAMVARAPTFRDVWPAVRAALSGCVIAAYNAYFDMRFLAAEAQRCGDTIAPPFFCMMYMRPLIGIGERCRLDEACRKQGVRLHDAHRAARDAMATAELLPKYHLAMQRGGISTYHDLLKTGTHKYLQSFRYSPLTPAATTVAAATFPRERVDPRDLRP